ncbi:MAG: type I glutamate--ammonia ligase [Planctomycetota bacterium]
MFSKSTEALDYIAKSHVEMVDLKVCGIGGRWLHITIPATRFPASYFEEGVGFDGSSGSGFTNVEDGDVVAIPDPTAAFVDPFFHAPTLSFICTTARADTKEPLGSDPRAVAQRAVEYLRSTRIADQSLMAPEFEFYVFDSLRFVNEPLRMSVEIGSSEARSDGSNTPAAPRQAYLLTPPTERLHDIRSEISSILEQMGVAVRYHHHEVGACGQCEIEVCLADLVRAADQAMLVKYVVKNVAARHGKLATFMPKPVFGEAGNGMHVHQKLDRAGQPLFFDPSDAAYAHLSPTALRYIGGLLTHGCALTGLTNPSTNSFKRLVPGFEAPVYLFFSIANRSAAIRVPRYAVSPPEKRIEYRPPDATGNVYLMLAAMLMAGLDGIASQIDIRSRHFGPFDVDIARQDAAFREGITPLPLSLGAALYALAADQHFLTKGGVFTSSFLENWIAVKRRDETIEMARRPHPYEYELYLDA